MAFSMRYWNLGRSWRNSCANRFRGAAEGEYGLAARHERQNRSEHDSQTAKPYPLHQRIEVGMNDWHLGIGAPAGVHDIKIFFEGRVNRDHGAGFFVRWIKTALRI